MNRMLVLVICLVLSPSASFAQSGGSFTITKSVIAGGELRPRGDALPAADRDGGDVESAADAAGCGDHRDGDAGGRDSVELFARP